MSIEEILKKYKDIAVVGISDKPDRYSYQVANYLMNNGFNIIPVNPMLKEWQGKKVYSDVKSIEGNIDVVDIFRRPEFIEDIVMDSRGKAKVIWMQEGIINEVAKKLAVEMGMEVVMDRCMKKEYEKLNKK
ncbi:MAG: succinyl-CoA synthetase [Ferroplasma sp. Type II]|uniref:CoA-binding protein n=1 Tax=Ferroplasma sp. Type II TaxID=261388 RepID=UPI00038965A1|nr:CoA-binding protein [Ferroplasma sp. Type II]EQB73648.1 MAG: succinyl-CoA synthetase [Ferroplasma sp. Type II]